MKLIYLTLALLFFPQPLFADSSPNSVPTKVHTSYELRNLKPIGFSEYYSVGQFSLREYMKFQNETGLHQFLYEESGVYSSLPEVHDIQQALSTPDYQCSADIDCDSKAFCTNSCKEMYYELSNLPAALAAPDVNHCRVTYFACTHEEHAVTKP